MFTALTPTSPFFLPKPDFRLQHPNCSTRNGLVLRSFFLCSPCDSGLRATLSRLDGSCSAIAFPHRYSSYVDELFLRSTRTYPIRRIWDVTWYKKAWPGTNPAVIPPIPRNRVARFKAIIDDWFTCVLGISRPQLGLVCLWSLGTNK